MKLITDREELARLILAAALEKIRELGLEARLGYKVAIAIERVRFFRPAGAIERECKSRQREE